MISGVALMIMAACCFSLMQALVKLLSVRIPIIELVFFRNILALPFVFFLLKRYGLSLRPKAPGLIFLRNLTGIIAMLLTYQSVSMLPLADAAFIGKLQPILVILFSPWMLRERTDKRVAVSVLIALVGLPWVVQPSIEAGNLGGLVRLSAAVFAAVAHMTVRKLSAHDQPLVIVMHFMLFMICVSAPVTWAYAVMPTALEGLGLLGIATAGVGGQLLMTMAYARQRAPVISTADYTGVVFALFWGYIFFGVLPSWSVVFGGALIVLGGLLLLRRGVEGPHKVYEMHVPS